MGKWFYYAAAVGLGLLGIGYLVLSWADAPVVARTAVAGAYAALVLVWAVTRVSRAVLDRYAGPGRSHDGPEADYHEPAPPVP